MAMAMAMAAASTPGLPSHGCISSNVVQSNRALHFQTPRCLTLTLNGFASKLCSLGTTWPHTLQQSRRQRLSVLMVLPTAKPERALSEKPISNWSARAVKSFCMGRMEARKMKYMNIGTESLLLGILADGTSAAAKLLRANGINLFSVKKEATKVLGRPDYYTPVPEPLAPTKTLLKALDQALDDASQSGQSGEVTTTHMLLAIWAIKGSAGQKILAKLGFNDKRAEELAQNIADEVHWPQL